MADRETFEDRARRLRDATEKLNPPPGLASRIADATLAHSPRQSWYPTLVIAGRGGLLVAALAAALALAIAHSYERQLDEAIAWTTLVEGP